MLCARRRVPSLQQLSFANYFTRHLITSTHLAKIAVVSSWCFMLHQAESAMELQICCPLMEVSHLYSLNLWGLSTCQSKRMSSWHGINLNRERNSSRVYFADLLRFCRPEMCVCSILAVPLMAPFLWLGSCVT